MSEYRVASCAECPFAHRRAVPGLPMIRYEALVCEHPWNTDNERQPADPPDIVPGDCWLRTSPITVAVSE